MVNFGLLATEIGSLVWGTPANFNDSWAAPAGGRGGQLPPVT